ncbi:tetratricopeptide repeat protein [Glycomyces sp. NPDC047369]
MQFYVRRQECKHIVWAGPLVNTAATLNVADELRGRKCPTCGETVGKVDFVVFKETQPTFDEAPAPRNTVNRLKRATSRDVKRTRSHLERLRADGGGLAATLRESALKLTPPDWQDTLSKIPVGVLNTYEPNAECIRFKDSPMPAIVFHQGLGGFLFKMNRSVFPLIRMGSMRGTATAFVKDEKTRRALRVQAVDTALEFLGVGAPRPKDLVDIPMVAKAIEMPLTRTMAAFVLCHEYGHAVLNHADELRSVGGGSIFSIMERSRAMELEADAWGQDALIGAFTRGARLEESLRILDDLFTTDAGLVKQDISHAAPCIALLYFEFLDTVEARLAEHGAARAATSSPYRRRARMAETGPQSTHPSNKDRFQALYGHLSEHGNFSAHTWVEAFEMNLEEITSDLDRLMDQTGSVPGKRMASRFPWARKAKRKSESWRNNMDSLEGRDDLRVKLENAFQSLEADGGDSMHLDQAEVERHLKRLEERAMKHYNRGEHAEAAALFTQILDRGETLDSVPLYSMLGASREELGDIEGAKAAYRRCLELVPGSDFAYMSALALGAILEDEGDDRGAEAAFTTATGSSLNDVRLRATFKLGVIAHDRRDIEKALRLYRQVYRERDAELSIFPETPSHAALNIGSIHEGRGEFREAVKMFVYARNHLPHDSRGFAIAEEHLAAIRSR